MNHAGGMGIATWVMNGSYAVATVFPYDFPNPNRSEFDKRR
jgi:hypothetical protein